MISLKLVETRPIHHTANNDTWIDILITNNKDIVVSYDRKLPYFPSRHDIISVTIETLRPETPADNYNCRSIGKITPTDLSMLLQNKDWSVFSLPENEFDMELGLTTLTENLQEAINTLAPEKTFKPRKHAPPWLNDELRSLLSERDATNCKYSINGSRQLLDELIVCQNL